MNISDLQYIESVDASEVQGAGRKFGKYVKRLKYGYLKKTSADAKADAGALAGGDVTSAKTYTGSFADSDLGVSEATSSSKASAKSVNYYSYH